MEKLTLEDALMIENVIEKINEIIDRLDAIDKRIDAHWKFHRFLNERIEKLEGCSNSNIEEGRRVVGPTKYVRSNRM